MSSLGQINYFPFILQYKRMFVLTKEALQSLKSTQETTQESGTTTNNTQTSDENANANDEASNDSDTQDSQVNFSIFISFKRNHICF